MKRVMGEQEKENQKVKNLLKEIAVISLLTNRDEKDKKLKKYKCTPEQIELAVKYYEFELKKL